MSTNIWLELNAICLQKQRVLHPLLRTIDIYRYRVSKYRTLRTISTYIFLHLVILALQIAYVLMQLIRDFLIVTRFILLCALACLGLLVVSLWLGLSIHTVISWGWSTLWVYGGLAAVGVLGGVFLAIVWNYWFDFADLYRYPVYRRWCRGCAVWRGLRKDNLYRLQALDKQLYACSRQLTLEDICFASKTARHYLPVFLDQLRLSRMIYARRNRNLQVLEKEWEGYLTFLFPKV